MTLDLETRNDAVAGGVSSRRVPLKKVLIYNVTINTQRTAGPHEREKSSHFIRAYL